MTAPLMESSSDEDDSILDQSLSGPVNNGSHYDEEDEVR